MATVDSMKNRKKTKKKAKLLRFFLSLILLAVITVVAVTLIANDGKFAASGILKLFGGSGSTGDAAVYSFDAGSEAVYADISGDLAVGSATGLQVYDRSAALVFSQAFEMACPTICSYEKGGAVYDIGGKTLKTFSLTGVTKEITTEGKIISASINENGWLALSTQESGYKGRVTVYDNGGNEVYKWYSAQGYVLSSEVSPDNKGLCALTLNDSGSKVVFFDMSSSDEQASCALDGALALEFRYLNNSSVLSVDKNALALVHTDGSSEVLLNYPDKYLTGYTLDSSSFSALILNDYLIGDQGSIITVDKAGNTLGTLETARKILSVSAGGDYLAVLYSDGLSIYDRDLKERAHFDETAGATRTIMRSDGTALLLLPHSAKVCSVSSD